MARLPQPGGDAGNWGEILNDYLSQSLHADGTLKDVSQSKVTGLSATLAAKADTAAIPTTPSQVGAEPTGLSAATKTLLDATYSKSNIAQQISLRARSQAFPSIAANPPTVSWSSAAAITNPWVLRHTTDRVKFLGMVPTDNVSFNYRGGTSAGSQLWAIEYEAEGIHSILWRDSNGTSSWRYQLFVDDIPVTASSITPAGVTSASGATFRMTITPSTAGIHRYRIEQVYMTFRGIEFEKLGTITPTPNPSIRMAIIGDSFVGGAGGVSFIDAFSRNMARLLGINAPYINGQGGTGYLNPGAGGTTAQVFGDSARLDPIITYAPHIVIFFGSVNDDGRGTQNQIQSAAAAAYQYIRNALPNTKLIVFGPQSTGAANSILENRYINRDAIKAASAQSPNVIGFIDQLGAGTYTTPAWSGAGVNYTIGDRVTRAGGVWQCDLSHTSVTTGANNGFSNFSPVSWLWGTGYSGALAGDGNRDRFLGPDNVHYTLEGHDYLASRCASSVADILSRLS